MDYLPSPPPPRDLQVTSQKTSQVGESLCPQQCPAQRVPPGPSKGLLPYQHPESVPTEPLGLHLSPGPSTAASAASVAVPPRGPPTLCAPQGPAPQLWSRFTLTLASRPGGARRRRTHAPPFTARPQSHRPSGFPQNEPRGRPEWRTGEPSPTAAPRASRGPSACGTGSLTRPQAPGGISG